MNKSPQSKCDFIFSAGLNYRLHQCEGVYTYNMCQLLYNAYSQLNRNTEVIVGISTRKNKQAYNQLKVKIDYILVYIETHEVSRKN